MATPRASLPGRPGTRGPGQAGAMAARRRPPPEARPPVRSSVLYGLRREGTFPRNPSTMESAYMREVQRRMDSNHKSRLRLRERERMQAEGPREQRAAGGLTGPLTPPGRNHDGHRASGTTTAHKVDMMDMEGKELQRSPPYPRAPVTGRGSKLPSIASATGKRQKVPEPSDAPDTRSSPATGSDRRSCFQAPALLLKVPSAPPTPAPAPSPPPGGQGCGERPLSWGEEAGEEEEEEEEAERERERERDLCRQQTGHILRRLRRERLRGSAMAGAVSGAGADPSPSPSPPAAGHLPFSHRTRPWSGRQVDEAPALVPAPAPVPVPVPAPATSSRGTQTPGTGHLVTLLTPGPHRLRPLTDPRPARGGSAGTATGVGGFLRPPLSLTVLAVSQLSGPEPGERPQEQPQGGHKPTVDPEVLRKLQESLLEEEDDEEGDVCRICLVVGGCPLNPLLEPCKCVGSLQFVHHDCLKKWLQAKVMSGASLPAVTTCELCKHTLKLDFDNFDVHEFHRKQAASQVEEQMSNSSLYMAVLLHLYEQRFTELMRLLSGTSTGFQFPRADSQTGEDASDTQNSESEEEEEEESGELRTHHTLSHRGRLLTFEPRDT